MRVSYNLFDVDDVGRASASVLFEIELDQVTDFGSYVPVFEIFIDMS
jgi:hypothetical protein